jgi:hypothetical protein
MNKKDLDAFEKYEGHGAVVYPLDSDNIREIEQDAFEAGAIHGRSQLNELRDANMAELYQMIEKLQKEIEQEHEKSKILLEALKINLPPIFDNTCEGCREAERISKKSIAQYNKLENL